MKPDFLVIGAMKCATSTVCSYLEDHPQTFMVPHMDPGFFSNDATYAKGWDWYESLFAGRGPGQLCGEGTNNYMAGALYPNGATRIAADLPDAKLIVMVRHPLDRIVSAWIQSRVDLGDGVPPTLDRAVSEMRDRFVDQSLYWRNLQRYRAHFPDERIFVGFMEELNRDPATFFAGLTDFLGIDRHEVARGHMNPSSVKHVPNEAYTAVNRLKITQLAKALLPRDLKTAVKRRFFSNPAKERPQFSPEVRARLVAELKADSDALLAHLGRPADTWRY